VSVNRLLERIFAGRSAMIWMQREVARAKGFRGCSGMARMCQIIAFVNGSDGKEWPS
jgi:hypothetical protein